MSKAIEQPTRPFIPYSLCILLFVCVWLQVLSGEKHNADTIFASDFRSCMAAALGLGM